MLSRLRSRLRRQVVKLLPAPRKLSFHYYPITSRFYEFDSVHSQTIYSLGTSSRTTEQAKKLAQLFRREAPSCATKVGVRQHLLCFCHSFCEPGQSLRAPSSASPCVCRGSHARQFRYFCQAPGGPMRGSSFVRKSRSASPDPDGPHLL